ncbi:UbiH/UbiF/VisC/COQ6 family ubiquinone biosynthesis hydroxylase [Sphingomonas jatrophae]|uniref:2-octaprenyl-6-methoxyphenol hydroxylase n=1 Tax=Sphingomonas jatrophae TaxID=1166337 RepID=A0A1I6LQM0_9SPHN|nr:UbiH/UbiF/VisC/COQ6 family ubiquinone biosynthesis hydroxylase [Sphingomonas jatrophae]SFS05785.1 2-octaprenyl-6-methoxyphenol hydroxylase [Sphingomonas jatrophae]
MDTEELRADVVILGAGLVGLTLALALDAHGLSAIVIDPADPASLHAPGHDGRASAVASASWRFLEAIGVAPRLEGAGCAIRTIAVRDGLEPRPLRFDADQGDPLGIMVENRTLRRTLHDAAAGAANVRLLQPARPVATERSVHGVTVTLADGRIARGALLVAAEGRQSPTREAAGIRIARWSYDHAAIVTMLGHERPHGHVAHEIFYPAGPFALLPLIDDAEGRHRSALVWSVAAADAPGLLGLGPRGFADAALKAMGGLLGSVELIAARSTYPLGFHHAATMTAERLALIGDAGHGIHPIAGQGLNLGFRDAAALAQVLVEGARLGLDPGDAQLLARYDRWRGLDTLSVAAATDGLTRLFGLPGAVPRAVRRFGLGVVERVGPLKDMFMAEARGESGELPTLLRGELV